MGSIRRPSKSVVRKRRAVAVAFASALRELQASGVVARHAIADELNRQGVPTERSGRWHPTTVIRMLTRLGMVKPAAGTVGAGAAVGPKHWLRSFGKFNRRGPSRKKPLR
jgi:hypothetical protein